MKTFLYMLPLMAVMPAAAEPAPDIVCEAPKHSFGTRDNTEVVTHVFTIENRGDLSLEILNTRTSCGCTVASLSREIVPPGESAELTAKLDLKGRQGLQSKTVTVHSNDPDTPYLTLTLSGNSRPGLEIKPARVYLQDVSATTVSRGYAEIISHRGNLVPGQVDCSMEQLSARLETITEGQHYKLHIETVPPIPSGRFAGTVRIQTNSKDRPILHVGVMGNVIGPVAYAPEKILLSGKNKRPVTRYIAVRPGSFKQLKVNEVEIPDPEIRVRVFALAHNQGYRLQLANIVAKDSLAGQAVVIHTNVPDRPQIRIPFEIIP